jgi:hypothetical protein
MNKKIEEIVLTVFKKDLGTFFSAYSKDSFSTNVNSLQTDFNNAFQTQIKQNSYSQLHNRILENTLVSTSDQLRNSCLELLNHRSTLFSALHENVEIVKGKDLGSLEGVISKEYTDNSTYFGQDDNNKRSGFGYFAEADMSYVYLGNWVDDHHKNGILLIKKEKQNEIFIGDFQFTGNSYNFKGLYFSILNNPSGVTGNSLTFAYGNFTDNQRVIEGIVCFSNTNNQDIDIYLGKLEELKMNDESAVLINFVNKNFYFYFGGFTANNRSHNGFIYRSDLYLLQLTYGPDNKLENAFSAFLLLPDKTLFNGRILIEGDFNITLGGNGTIVFKNNHYYKGGFINGKKEGKGNYIIRNESNEVVVSYEATFKQDQIVNGVISKNVNENLLRLFEGDFLNNAPSRGLYFYENGDTYEGDFINNAREGRGKYNYADKCTYEGEWKSNLKHGQGKYVDVDNNIFEAVWQNNHLTKIEKCTPADEDN